MPFEVVCYKKLDKNGEEYFAYKVCDENDKCIECDSEIDAFALHFVAARALQNKLQMVNIVQAL